MNKLFNIFAAFAIVLAMCACAGGNTPSAVAEKAVKCIQDKNVEGYVDLVYLPQKEGTSVEEQRQGLVSLLSAKMVKTLDEKGGLKSYDVIKEEIAEDGKTAVVDIKIVYGNGEEDTNSVKLIKDENGDWKLDGGK